MPKLEPKAVQRELENDRIWPVYWIHGPERMKSRELLKRIRKATIGEGPSLGEEVLDASEVDAATVLDAAQSMALGGGPRFIVVRDAHLLKDAETLAPLFGPSCKKEDLASVCVFLAKDLDGRKKFSKTLIEKAAVVGCDEVGEAEREAWIGYLAKRKGVSLPAEVSARLCTLDPWTLDIVDQEVEKFFLSQSSEAVLNFGALEGPGSDQFLDSFFSRALSGAMRAAESFADQPDESLPLLGLLGWNTRHLGIWLAERGRPSVKMNPYVAERLAAWSRYWKLEEVLELQSALEELDFSIKQKPLLPLGMWDDLVIRFCS